MIFCVSCGISRYYFYSGTCYRINGSHQGGDSITPKNIAIIAAVSAILAGAAITAVFLHSNPPAEKSAIPIPCITSPAQPDGLFTNSRTIAIYGNSTDVVAVDLNLEENDIVSARFEYSADGVNWTLIEFDDDSSFAGEWFGEEGGKRNGEGFAGWGMEWNTTNLPEGKYYLKVTMADADGQSGESIEEIYYDPTPPIPEIISPAYLSPITGSMEFRAITADEDIAYMKLLYLNGSTSGKTQTNIGDVNQHLVGPNVDGSSTLDGKNNFCGPAAAANALWRLAQKNPDLLNHSGSTLDNLELAKTLARKTERNQNDMQARGTTPEHLRRGIKDYLEEVGLDCNNTEHGYRVELVKAPGWRNYEDKIRTGEAVTLLLVEKGKPASGGHFVTGTSVKSGSGTSHPTNISDPGSNGETAQTGEGTWKEGGPKSYDELSLGGKTYQILYMIYVSPKNSTDAPADVSCGWNSCGECCIDNSPDGGWAASWDTSGIKNGFYVVRAVMEDSKGNIGTCDVLVEVNHSVPVPLITSPVAGEIIKGVYTVLAEETSGQAYVGACIFESSQDGTEWQIIGSDENGTDGWSAEWNTSGLPDGPRFARATMVGAGGKNGSDTVAAIIDNSPPQTDISAGLPKYGDSPVFVTDFTEFNISADDAWSGISSMWFRIRGAAYDSGLRQYSGNFALGSFGLSDGEYNITFNSIDGVGNVEPANSLQICIDNAPPEPILVKPLMWQTISETFEIVADETGGADDIYYCKFEYMGASGEVFLIYADYSAVDGWRAEWDTTKAPNGEYALIATMADKLGNYKTAQATITVGN